MDRRMVDTAAIPLDLDINQNAQFAMVGLGYLAQAAVGTSPWCAQLAASPTTPASLTIDIGPGSIGQMTVIDQTNPGTSAIASSDPVMKIGVNTDPTPLTFVPPAAAGDSQVFLIQAQMQETDGGATVLQYFNPTPPYTPFTGPNNSGASTNTLRTQRVAIEVVAGSPAPTGSQAAPAATSGWEPLYLVTLANGQTTITAANIAVAPGAPFVTPLQQLAGTSAPGRLISRQVITSNVSVPVPAGANMMKARVWGGGGGSGGTQGSNSASNGGGGGEYAEGEFPVSAGATYPVVIGTAGAAGAGGSGITDGGTGGTTSIGSLISAVGGFGGGQGNGMLASGNSGGGGGTGGTGGDLHIQGGHSTGGPVIVSNSAGTAILCQQGGHSPQGGQGGWAGATSAATAGSPAGFPGGGAGGSCNGANGTAGASGLAIIEFYS